MFTLSYDSLNFADDQLPEFVESVSTHTYGKRVSLNENIASGDYKVLEFTNGFRAYISNYILHKDFEMEMAVDDEEYHSLHINQIQAGNTFEIILNGESVSYDDRIINSVILTSSKDSLLLKGSEGACVNRLKILIPKQWLANHLPVFDESLLLAYLALDRERLQFDALDKTYRTMVDKIMNTEENSFYLSVTENIVAVITERFFNRLNTKMKKSQPGLD